MISLQNKTLENERIELGGKDSYYLGPNLTLRSCTVVLKVSAKALTINKARFIDCRIEAKKALNNFYWLDAFITKCHFTGKFIGSDFGNLPSHFDPEGGIEHSDFSEAILDGCRFIGCDSSTIKFPRWPCFTILDPVGRLAKLKAVRWPGDADILVENIADFPPSTAAVTYLATAIEKELDAGQEELRAVLEKLGNVIM
jgi:hypothetical protein